MVEGGCWAVLMVCGWPGMFVVVDVMCGRCGGRWLWDEEGSHVTICDACDFWIMNVPCTQICTGHTIYNSIASIIQFCSV